MPLTIQDCVKKSEESGRQKRTLKIYRDIFKIVWDPGTEKNFQSKSHDPYKAEKPVTHTACHSPRIKVESSSEKSEAEEGKMGNPRARDGITRHQGFPHVHSHGAFSLLMVDGADDPNWKHFQTKFGILILSGLFANGGTEANYFRVSLKKQGVYGKQMLDMAKEGTKACGNQC